MSSCGIIKSVQSVSSELRIWVRSRNCGCLVTWFCYQLIAKPGNKTATVLWPDPDIVVCYGQHHLSICLYITPPISFSILQDTIFYQLKLCLSHPYSHILWKLPFSDFMLVEVHAVLFPRHLLQVFSIMLGYKLWLSFEMSESTSVICYQCSTCY